MYQKTRSRAAVAIAVLASTLTVGALATAPSQAASAEVTFLSSRTVPQTPVEGDPQGVEVGVRLSTTVSGQVNAIRFYKGGSMNGGTHVGHLWSASGTLLSSVAFGSETKSGWQEARLAKPVSFSSGQSFVVSYWAPRGGYSVTEDYFSGTRARNGLVASPGAGVYSYASGVVPSKVYRNSNYFVDVAFAAAAAPGTSSASPTASATSTSPTTSASPRPTATATPSPSATSSSPRPSATATSPAPSPTQTTPTPSPSSSDTRSAWERGLAWYQANTGVPAGITLKSSGSITVSTAGSVIEGLDVNGTITVAARNVTIRNSRVRGTIINAAESWDQNLLIDHVEIDVSGLAMGTQAQKYAIQSFWGTTVRNVEAHGMAQGLGFSGYVNVYDSWIYGIRSNYHHAETIISNGDNGSRAGNVTIARNWLDADDVNSKGYLSGALCMYGDFGQIRNVTVDGNYLTGDGYLLYAGAVSNKPYPLPYNVTVKNNTFDPKQFGAVYPSKLDPTSTANWANNRLISGAIVPAPTGNA